MTGLDPTSPNLAGRNAALRVNSCPSWIAKMLQAHSVSTPGGRATPMRPIDLTSTPKARNSKCKTRKAPLSRKKISVDIGRHWSTLVDICRLFTPSTEGPRSRKPKDAKAHNVRFTQAISRTNGQMNQDGTGNLRISKSSISQGTQFELPGMTAIDSHVKSKSSPIPVLRRARNACLLGEV